MPRRLDSCTLNPLACTSKKLTISLSTNLILFTSRLAKSCHFQNIPCFTNTTKIITQQVFFWEHHMFQTIQLLLMENNDILVDGITKHQAGWIHLLRSFDMRGHTPTAYGHHLSHCWRHSVQIQQPTKYNLYIARSDAFEFFLNMGSRNG